MARKPGLTLDQHRAVGCRLGKLQDELTTLVCLIGNAYPVNSKPVRMVGKAHDALSRLRCELDNVVFREHGDAASTQVYYGGPHHPDDTTFGRVLDETQAPRGGA